MNPTIEENKKETLMDLIGQLDDELASFLHMIEEDDNVTEETWHNCESKYTRISRIWRELWEEVNYS